MPLTSPTPPVQPVDWLISLGPVNYQAAILFMEARVAAIRAGTAAELVWLLEHPALYTAGTSADPKDLLSPDRFPVYATGRGGQYTYHGPGQRVIYVMLDVKRRGGDVRAFVTGLERWLIDVLAEFQITGRTHRDRVGVWVSRARSAQDAGKRNGARGSSSKRNGTTDYKPKPAPAPDAAELLASSPTPAEQHREDKIAAIGIRLRKWVSYHGMSLNVNPCLDHFAGIVPCGLNAYGVTSLHDLGCDVTLSDADLVLRRIFERRFGPTLLITGNIVASDLVASHLAARN